MELVNGSGSGAVVADLLAPNILQVLLEFRYHCFLLIKFLLQFACVVGRHDPRKTARHCGGGEPRSFKYGREGRRSVRCPPERHDRREQPRKRRDQLQQQREGVLRHKWEGQEHEHGRNCEHKRGPRADAAGVDTRGGRGIEHGELAPDGRLRARGL